MIKLIKHSRIVKDSILNAMDKVNENTFDRYIVFNMPTSTAPKDPPPDKDNTLQVRSNVFK
jgi:hypothetical protein